VQVFISWSKPTGRQLGMVLHGWLPEVMHRLHPWISSEDISKGQRWGSEVGAKLEQMEDGIICVTRENLKEPWLNFEAGALAKSLDDSRVRPVLLGLSPTDITGPLAQFQATVSTDKVDMLKLVRSLNERCDPPLEEARLERSFDRLWLEYSEQIRKIPNQTSAPLQIERDVDDVARETLDRVRTIQRLLINTTKEPVVRSHGSGTNDQALQNNLYHIYIATSRDALIAELAQHAVRELREIAKFLKIDGVRDLQKSELIETIVDTAFHARQLGALREVVVGRFGGEDSDIVLDQNYSSELPTK